MIFTQLVVIKSIINLLEKIHTQDKKLLEKYAVIFLAE